MTRRVVVLLAVGVGAGLAAAVPVGLGLVPRQWGFAAVAFGLSLVPGVVTLVLVEYLGRKSPYGRLVGMVAAKLLRLTVGFGGAAAVVLLAGIDDRAGRIEFLAWVLFAYLVTLVAETVLLARAGRPAAAGVAVSDGEGRAAV